MTSSNQSPDMSNQAAKLLEDPSFSIVDREEFVRLAGVVIANTNDIVVITDIPTEDQEPRIVYVNKTRCGNPQTLIRRRGGLVKK